MLGDQGPMFSFQQTRTSLRQIVDAVIPPAETAASGGKKGRLDFRPHGLRVCRGSMVVSLETASPVGGPAGTARSTDPIG